MGRNKAHGNRQRKQINRLSKRYPRAWSLADGLRAELARDTDRPHADDLAPKHDPAPHARPRPRPHWRRAHWHSYWTGPRDGERIARLKWIPPIPVGLDGQA